MKRSQTVCETKNCDRKLHQNRRKKNVHSLKSVCVCPQKTPIFVLNEY